MSASKKSKEKPSKLVQRKTESRLLYSFLLLLGANVVLFIFLIFFLLRLFQHTIEVQSYGEIPMATVPVVQSEERPVTTASSYIVYDPLTRSSVYEKNEQLRLSPASSIKILSALVVLDHYSPDEFLQTVQVASPDDSKMGLYYGEEISVRNLLYGLLLASGNDAAKNLAYHYPGGTEGFVAAMNAIADKLNLVDSKFVDPSGFEDGNYSTAFELARLASYAMQNEEIREIVGTQRTVVFNRQGTASHALTNLNELLVDPQVTGIKTGFTNEAGDVLITSYLHQGRELIIVVMKSDNRFLDTRTIIDHINKNVSYSSVI